MQTGYANGNYYEIHGTGAPLVVLHGGLASCATIGPLLRAFGQTRRAIGIDLHTYSCGFLATRAKKPASNRSDPRICSQP